MPDNPWISATAPPSIANLAVGFDCLGMAVEGDGDIVEMRRSADIGVHIMEILGDGGKLTKDPDGNTATAGVLALLNELKARGQGIDHGIEVRVLKEMPLGSGMGSSASSAAAGVFAANELLGRPFSVEELTPFALVGESRASGAIHGDNVLPSLFGGLILIRDLEPLDLCHLPFPEELFVLLIHPHVEVLTAQSRGRLKEQVSMADHIQQSADLGAFVHALHNRDIEQLRRSLNDRIIGPQRVQDIPSFKECATLVKELGALNYDISGSGPSSFAFCPNAEVATEAGFAVKNKLAEKHIEVDINITRLDTRGARRLADRT